MKKNQILSSEVYLQDNLLNVKMNLIWSFSNDA